MITSKRKLTNKTFHPIINYESCRVIICLVGLAAVFLYSISLKRHKQEHKSNKGKNLFYVLEHLFPQLEAEHLLLILCTGSQLRH